MVPSFYSMEPPPNISVRKVDGGMVDECEGIYSSTENNLAILPKWKPNIMQDGYYLIEYDVLTLIKE